MGHRWHRARRVARTRRRCGVGCQREQDADPDTHDEQYECIADDEFSLANSINVDPDSDAHQVDTDTDPDKDNSQPDGLCDQVGSAGARVVRGADW